MHEVDVVFDKCGGIKKWHEVPLNIGLYAVRGVCKNIMRNVEFMCVFPESAEMAENR